MAHYTPVFSPEGGRSWGGDNTDACGRHTKLSSFPVLVL